MESPSLAAQFRGQRGAEQYLAAARRLAGLALEFPEALVDAVDLHARGAAAAVSCATTPSMAIIGQALPERRRQLLAEKAVARDHGIGVAQPRQHQIAQAGAHRIAHQQRAAEHARRRRDAQQYRQVRAPIPGEITRQQGGDSHDAIRIAAGNRPASSALCVTTIRIVFCCWCSSSSSDATTPAESWSRLPVGSSQSSSSGWRISARASATRCFSPPESSAGRWSSRSPSPTCCSSSRARSVVSRHPVVPDQRRNQHVFQHRTLRQQAMVLKDEADRLVAERRQFFFGQAGRDRVPSSVTRAGSGRFQRRPGYRAACSCPRPRVP